MWVSLVLNPCHFRFYRLALAEGESLSDPYPYCRLVGKLIYLEITRQEFSYAIHVLSQFMQSPKAAHWEAALRIFRYLKGNSGQGILLRSDSDLSIYAWCDSDWTGYPITRRSLTGWFIQLGGSPISWKRKSIEWFLDPRQQPNIVPWLTPSASYFGFANCCKLSVLIVLSPFHFTTITCPLFILVPILYYNCHFIHDEILNGVINTKHVSTKTQIADIFTKALGRREFDEFLSNLGVCDLHTPT